MPELSRFTVYLRDNDNLLIERLDNWTDLTAIRRFNRTGSWNLEVPKDQNVTRLITPQTGIIIQCDGETVFSGPGGVDFNETKNSIQMAGTCDNVLLETPARPTPSLNNGPYPDAYDVTTGVASTIMRSLVDRNIGPSAPSDWKIPTLILAADPLLGSTITARARFDPLQTLLYELASTPIATGLGFQILHKDIVGNAIEFSIYQPRDLSSDTIFSVELRTAEDYEHRYQTPPANYFIVGGGDAFGLDRTVVEGGDTTNIALVGRRVAQFVDRRGVESPSELTQELAELIAGAVTVDTINIIPNDVPSLPYKDTWDLGDLVTAVVEDTSYPRLIREIEYDFSPENGLIIKPLVADPFGSTDDVEARYASTLANRISNIERNFNVPNDSIIEDMLHPTMKWYPGDIKLSARSAAQSGWLLCDGSAVSRSTYSRLFSAIGTTYGVGDGSTTFNIPNSNDRYPVGKGSSHFLGPGGGSSSLSFPHTHSHSHGMNNHTHSSQAHTHPGSHSHGIGSHTHSLSNHTHDVNIGSFDSGGTNIDSVAVGHASLGSGATDHHHSIDPPNTSSSIPSNNTSGGGSGSTDSNTNAHAASYSGSPSGPSTNSTENDSAGASPSTASFDPLHVVYTYEIWTGVIP